MPGAVMEEIHKDRVVDLGENGDSVSVKENLRAINVDTPPQILDNGPTRVEGNCMVEPSIEQLYHNVCEMQSSEPSPSRHSFASYGEESRIDSELGHLVGGDMREAEIMEEDEEVQKPENDASDGESGSKKTTLEENLETVHSENTKTSSAQSKKVSQSQLDVSAVSSPKGRKPLKDKKNEKNLKSGITEGNPVKKLNNSAFRGSKLLNGIETSSDLGLENPDLGPFLLKQARDLLSSGDNPKKALDLAFRAAKSFEKCSKGESTLDLVMCLHVTAAIYSSLGRYSDAIPVVERSIEIPVIEEGQDHALAKFSGYMQLGDTYSMLGQLENSIVAYSTGLEVQRRILGDSDLRYGETCRYLAEAYVQALEFDEAQRLCEIALNIHRENGSPASLEEVADRRLLGLICESKGDHEAALEHLVLASMAMVANGQEAEVATIDSSIGDIYLSLNRFDEAIFAYEKAITALKSTKGENHPAVASVFVRLADLYNQTGKFKESKSYCENALQIFGKPTPGIASEEIASGLTEISAIYESMNEPEQALKLLQKALKIYDNAPGQQHTIAGIEAQIGVLHYMLGNHSESYGSFKSAVTKLRASGEKKSAFFGIVLNQMGLACVQHVYINEAVELFEEARVVLEQEYGPYHPDTLAVYSNLAGAYDALGRLDDAIEILESVVGMREEKLGTANPDVDDEKRRLAELLKEAGRVRSRKARSLEHLLDSNHHPTTQNDNFKA